jgi:hypothetical protein
MSHDKKPNHFVTEGEKKFDFLTYTGINYAINVLMSVGAVYWVERTHGGQKMMQKFVDWAGKIPGVDKDTAKLLASKSFFLSGGFAVLAPVKWMEDAKVHLVKKWNREIYGDKANTDAAIQQSEREVEEAPKQGWASVMSSRILSLIPFYMTVGLLWTRTSMLAKATNPELRAMSKEAIKTMETNHPEKFSQIASKGSYADKPIGWASRSIGKAVAKITGDEKALAKIAEMEKTYPGMIKEGATKATRDPDHSAVPYYFISEAVTSAMVAAGMYSISRVMGPIFDKKHVATTSAPVPAPQSQAPQPAAQIQLQNAQHTPLQSTQLAPAK